MCAKLEARMGEAAVYVHANAKQVTARPKGKLHEDVSQENRFLTM
jgi:hypothetical protein